MGIRIRIPEPDTYLYVKYHIVVLLLFCTGLIHSQRKPRIKGNRTVTEVQTALPEFHAVTLLDDLEITLERADSPGYRITADDNLIDVLTFEVIRDTLYIRSFYTITGKKQLDITVNFQEIGAITVKQGAIAMNELLSAEELSLETEGVARLQMNVKTARLRLQMADQSKGDLHIDSDTLELFLDGRADARIYQISKQLALQMTGNSDAELDGSTGHMNLNLSGAADLKASRLEAGTIGASLQDTSSARLLALDLLELQSRGAARTYLYGNPRIQITEFADSSVLTKQME